MSVGCFVCPSVSYIPMLLLEHCLLKYNLLNYYLFGDVILFMRKFFFNFFKNVAVPRKYVHHGHMFFFKYSKMAACWIKKKAEYTTTKVLNMRHIRKI